MPSAAPSVGAERRDAVATRSALLRAARRRFSLHGYADVTLRDVAADADVSAALVVKYFGNKEALFAEAVSFEQDAALLLDCELPRLGEHLVRTLLDAHDRTQSDPLLRAVFTATRPGGAEFRRSFEGQFVAALAARLPGGQARLRAELICAHLIGLGAARLALRGEAITAEPVERLVALFAPLLQSYLDAPS